MKKFIHLHAAKAYYSSITTAYQLIRNQSPYCLQEGFETSAFRFKDFAEGFTTHPESEHLISLANSFGAAYDIWLANASEYITCFLYLSPDGAVDRMIPIVQNCAIDFYLNDVMGREMFPQLSPGDQQKAAAIIRRLSRYHPAKMRKTGALVEIANAEMLRGISLKAPAS